MQSRTRFGSAGTLIAFAACGLALASGTTLAQQGGGDDQALPKGFQVTPVLKSGKSAGGAPFSYPQTDSRTAVDQSFRLAIQPSGGSRHSRVRLPRTTRIGPGSSLLEHRRGVARQPLTLS
jgi:hypothetical protein